MTKQSRTHFGTASPVTRLTWMPSGALTHRSCKLRCTSCKIIHTARALLVVPILCTWIINKHF